jgi:hypothetical protein
MLLLCSTSMYILNWAWTKAFKCSSVNFSLFSEAIYHVGDLNLLIEEEEEFNNMILLKWWKSKSYVNIYVLFDLFIHIFLIFFLLNIFVSLLLDIFVHANACNGFFLSLSVFFSHCSFLWNVVYFIIACLCFSLWKFLLLSLNLFVYCDLFDE